MTLTLLAVGVSAEAYWVLVLRGKDGATETFAFGGRADEMSALGRCA